MARPFKQGLSYFPLDVKFFDDIRVQELFIEYGFLGILVYLRVLTLVYENGYYLEISVERLSKKIYYDLKNQSLRRVDRVSEVIRSLAKCELLDSNLMTNDVITSKSIQKQWLTSVSRRKKIDKTKYWLLSEYEESKVKNFNESCDFSSTPNYESSDNNIVNDDNNSVNVVASTQNKKENKNKKERDKKDKYDESTFGRPKVHFITKCLITNGYISEFDMNLLKYNELAKDMINEFDFDIVLEATNYIVKYSKRADPPVDDKFEFYRESIYRNCEMLRKRNNGEGLYGETIEDFVKALVEKDKF